MYYFLNAIGGLFLTSAFLGAAGWEVTDDLITLGQFSGMTFLVLAQFGHGDFQMLQVSQLNLLACFMPLEAFYLQ